MIGKVDIDIDIEKYRYRVDIDTEKFTYSLCFFTIQTTFHQQNKTFHQTVASRRTPCFKHIVVPNTTEKQ